MTAYRRYVAIGDSTAEGLDDPDGLGGYRGWANRLAERLSALQGGVLYANLALRGRRTRQIRHEQLAPALGHRPDLVTLACGTNDVLRPRFEAAAFHADVLAMQRAFVDRGAVVLTFTLPDLTPVMPVARPLAGRVRAMNQALRDASRAGGARLVDVAAHPVASDPRLWSEDRLHANSRGHALVAQALAHALGLPGADASWQRPLPAAAPLDPAARLAVEMRWCRRYLLPWLWKHANGRSSGDGRRAKRPELTWLPAQAGPTVA